MSDFVTCKAPAGGLAPKYIPFPAMRMFILFAKCRFYKYKNHHLLVFAVFIQKPPSPRSTSVLKEQLVPYL